MTIILEYNEVFMNMSNHKKSWVSYFVNNLIIWCLFSLLLHGQPDNVLVPLFPPLLLLLLLHHGDEVHGVRHGVTRSGGCGNMTEGLIVFDNNLTSLLFNIGTSCIITINYLDGTHLEAWWAHVCWLLVLYFACSSFRSRSCKKTDMSYYKLPIMSTWHPHIITTLPRLPLSVSVLARILPGPMLSFAAR